MQNIAEILENIAISKNGSNKLHFKTNEKKEINITYYQLYNKAVAFSKLVCEKGIKSGEHVLVCVENPFHYILAFWGLIMADVIPVIVSYGGVNKQTGQHNEMLRSMKNILKNVNIVSDSPEINFEIEYEHFINIVDVKCSEGEEKEVAERKRGKDDIAAIYFSSGSTGTPKGIPLSHINIIEQVNAINNRFNISENDRILNWLPLTHIFGFTYLHLSPLFLGAEQLQWSTELFVNNIENYLEEISKGEITIVGGMNFSIKLLSDYLDKDNSYNFSSLQHFYVCGEMANPQIIRTFKNKACSRGLKNAVINPAYGMTESGCIISVDDEGYFEENSENNSCVVSQGRVYNEIDLMIIDEKGERVNSEEVGEICIKGKAVFSGYCFNSNKKEDFLEGYFKTGDIGFIKNEKLYVTGRKKDIIIVNGINYYPSDFEYIIGEKFGIRSVLMQRCGVNHLKDDIIVFFEGKETFDENVSLSKKICNELLEYSALEISYFVPLKNIKVTERGKTNKKIYLEEFNQGVYDDFVITRGDFVKNVKNDENIGNGFVLDKVIKICSNILGKNISAEENFFYAGGDSVKIMQLQAELYKAFKVNVTMKELLQAPSILNYMELVCKNEEPCEIGTSNEAPVEADKTKWNDPFALTEIQMAYMIGRSDMYDAGGISTKIYYEYIVDLDIPRLQEAVNKVIKSQKVLQTVIYEDGTQKVLDECPEYIIDIKDISDYSHVEKTQYINKERERISTEMYDFEHWPMFALEAIKVDEKNYHLLLGIDLMILDAYHVLKFKDSIMSYYLNPDMEIVDLNFSFRDYVIETEKIKLSKRYELDKAYWMEKIDTFPSSPQLVYKKSPSNIRKPKFVRKSFELNEQEYKEITSFAKRMGVSISAIVSTMYAFVLSRYSNQEECAINFTVFDRQLINEDVKEVMGDYTSTILVPFKFTSKCTNLSEIAKITQNNIVDGLEHRSFSGVAFGREIKLSKNISNGAIMPFVFTSTLGLGDDSTRLDFGEMVYGISQTSQVFIDCQVNFFGGKIVINWDYIEEMFESSMINDMFTMFKYGVKHISDLKHISEVIDSTDNTREIVSKYNDTQKDISSKLLHSMFEESVERFPDKVAVKDSEGSITYKELNGYANKVAAKLQREGISVGDFVGVKAYRKKETIAHILGILKSGAAYVPIDPENPLSRQQDILTNSNCKLCIDKEYYADSDSEEYEKIIQKTSQIAYVIYTSGSTGKPKGVVITHDAASNTILDINERYEICEEDKVIGLSSMCFDLSVYDIFGSLAAGATLVMVPDIHNISQIVNIVDENEITIWNSVPAIMQMYVDEREFSKTTQNITWNDLKGNLAVCEDSLRLIILSGDWIPLSLPERINQIIPGVELISMGGATEASIWSIYYPINEVKADWNSIPYGKPLSNQSFYVMGYNDYVCPVDVPGELCIGGRGLALEYHNDIEKTESSYFIHPQYGRLYRTGDIGVLHAEGNIEFLGRKDNQVKIAGHRIELGEIENAFRLQKNVLDVVVITKQSNKNTPVLYAYVVYDGELDSIYLKKQIATVVPKYMIPTHIIQLDSIPLTSNGKVNRKDLPDVKEEIKEKILPRTWIEKELYYTWQNVLQIEEIGINEDFYDVGGDSLKLIRISSEIQRKFKTRVSHVELSNAGTIILQAKYVEELLKQNKSNYIDIQIEPDKEHMYDSFELTQMQRAYLLGRDEIYELGGISTHGYYEYQIALDIERLEDAVNKVNNKQNMLRMVITDDGKQKFIKDVKYKIEIIDVQGLSEREQKHVIMSCREKYSHEIMNPSEWPLFKLIAIKIDKLHSVLIFSVDLLTMDAASVQMFKHLVMSVYENPNYEIPSSDFTFRDFVNGIEKIEDSNIYKEDEKYWNEKSYDFPESPQIPLCIPVSHVDNMQCERLAMEISSDKWKKIKDIISRHGVTPSAVLCTIFAKVLSYYSNQPTCAINMTTFNRYDFHQDVDKIIGDFTSTMLLDFDFGNQNLFWDYVKKMQNNITQNLEHRSFGGVEFMKKIRQNGENSHKYIAPIVFTSTLSSSDVKYDKDFGKMIYGVSQTSQVYLDCQVMEQEGRLNITWDYVKQLLDHSMMDKMFYMFENAINEISEEFTISDIIATSNELEMFVEKYNDTETDIPSMLLHEMFLKSVQLYPDKIAVKDEKESYTYAELDQKSSKVAVYLKKNGITEGDFVGVKAHRTCATIANILGILKSGAAYVPIDPDNPKQRQDDILANSMCKLCIEGECAVDENAEEYVFINIDTNKNAYVIYTSGSTGKPKGVVITHDAAANTIQDINKKYQITEDDNIIGLSSMCFDLSVYDIFGSLSAGATLVMIPDIHDVKYIAKVVEDEEITIWNSVPAVMQMYVEELERKSNNSVKAWNTSESSEKVQEILLRLVLLSGDWIPITLPKRIMNLISDIEIISLGGATEASIWSIYYPITEIKEEWKSIPYGIPLENQTFYVLDYDKKLCEFNVPGELYIGGRGVAKEYHNDPIKTQQSYFVHSRFGRLYRTGDFGVFRKEGYIEFLGRRDNQIKIRGHRIELGEIETAIKLQRNIQDGAVIVCKNEEGIPLIAAFIVSDVSIDKSQFKQELSEKIPKYMMPYTIVQLDELPLTNNGKINRKKLEELIKLEKVELLRAQTAIEIYIEKIWKSVLNLNDIGVNQDFYELNGDSIKLFTIIAKIEEHFNIKIPKEYIFSLETIHDMANQVEELMK